MNTLIPESWIIQEEIRRQTEKKRKNGEGEAIPISLPEHSESPRDRASKENSESNHPKQETIIIIDI